jgi:hypothetical protein
MKITVRIFLLVVLILSFIFQSIAFDGKDLVLIHGQVKDSETNKPLGVTIVFFSQSGKQIQAKSNSSDGSYQQVLQAGEKYYIVFRDYVLMGDNPELELDKKGKYTEIEKNFSVRKIETGLPVCSFNPFKPNLPDLIANDFLCLNELKTFLENNPKVNVIITIHTHDSNPKPYDKKVTYLDSKNKTKTKKVKVSTAEQLQELADKRINSIKKLLNSMNISERKVTFEVDTRPDLSKSPKDKKKSKSKNVISSLPTVYIKVGKVLNL